MDEKKVVNPPGTFVLDEAALLELSVRAKAKFGVGSNDILRDHLEPLLGTVMKLPFPLRKQHLRAWWKTYNKSPDKSDPGWEATAWERDYRAAMALVTEYGELQLPAWVELGSLSTDDVPFGLLMWIGAEVERFLEPLANLKTLL